jgi:superfamily I DNA/RNA helicase
MEDPRGKAGMPWQDCFEFSFIKKMYIDGIKANMGEKRPHCEIGTIHSMKGRECDVVVITPDLYGIFATDYKLEKNPLDFARLFYVAVTRASLGVYILFPKAPVFYEELMGWNI